MPFPRFITFKDGDPVYILLTSFPFYVGKVNKCETDYAMYQIKREVKCEIPGYRIVVTFEGTLEGNRVFVGDQPHQFIKLVREMGRFYLQRIQNDPKRYQKWKIP
jgi:hypothetical protein